MKRLNFYPYYCDLLKSRLKTTTFRLNDFETYKESEKVMLTLGWDENEAKDLHEVTIKNIYRKRICDLDDYDFDGESPDCKSQEATKLVLSCIYRIKINITDEITIIKFTHNL